MDDTQTVTYIVWSDDQWKIWKDAVWERMKHHAFPLPPKCGIKEVAMEAQSVLPENARKPRLDGSVVAKLRPWLNEKAKQIAEEEYAASVRRNHPSVQESSSAETPAETPEASPQIVRGNNLGDVLLLFRNVITDMVKQETAAVVEKTVSTDQKAVPESEEIPTSLKKELAAMQEIIGKQAGYIDDLETMLIRLDEKVRAIPLPGVEPKANIGKKAKVCILGLKGDISAMIKKEYADRLWIVSYDADVKAPVLRDGCLHAKLVVGMVDWGSHPAKECVKDLHTYREIRGGTTKLRNVLNEFCETL